MNTAYIMLGSNLNPEKNLEQAKEKISGLYEIITIGSEIKTKAHGKNYKADFSNQAIKILSEDILKETKYFMKQIENELGRTAQSKKDGLVPIDIDIVIWNDNVVHRDYERFAFVRECIDEIS